ncbi:ATP-dependent RNA helicase HrpA [Mariniluteicoccus endophyticus]
MPEPQITYPDLPISARVDDIQSAVRDHQVVVVAGETGSGKTTQLPKMCLQLGLGRIAHTQPRRLAARSVAERIAEEMGSEIGELVGYQVRFTRRAGRDTRIKVMTDGVLLAEISHDRLLKRYDCIIIDEAHERSLNIDFLLGYLKQLLPRRPDLKVVITSATIDTERFAQHFAAPDGTPAPIIEVSGRTYPVEVRYRPIREDGADGEPGDIEPRDQVDAICDAVTELRAEGTGDILVFLSGEREIRDTADALEAMKLRFTEVVPLYARLSAAEQHKVFTPHTGTRIVLATNVAETSLTVPGIRYVIDPGTARISRYSVRTKVQRLPIEPVSQASANQRSGRCGRVAPGIAIRLYSEEDFEARPAFTEPEILRTNLASVILQMADAGLGDITDFPFVEPPDSSQIADGLRLLDELGALEPAKGGARTAPRLTKTGKRLSRIPLDPRLARMLVEAEKQGCLDEVMVIVAGLTVQDPRERPTNNREQADALHRRFWAAMPAEGLTPPTEAKRRPGSGQQEERRRTRDGAGDQPDPDGSDFLAYLRLWDYLRDQRRVLSGNAFRRMCRDEFLNFLRVREWQDLHQQLVEITRDLKLERNRQPGTPQAIHTAILSGLLSHVGLADLRDEKKAQPGGKRRRGPREYLGARGARFAINPGSSVARTQPELVMAGELVETTRLWARDVAGIEAAWVEEVGAHLLKRSYSEPHWSARSGSVMAMERVMLLGVPLIAQRPVAYAKIDPVAAREMFIRSALVEGDWRTRHHFFARNEKVRADAAELEERTRRRDIVVDDQVIFDFYDARVPHDVVSQNHFDAWWRKKRHEDDAYLDLVLDDLVADPDAVGADDFPDHWTTAGHDLPITYVFDPGSGQDGVTVEIDLPLLNQVSERPFTWQVPGLRHELATELIRSLPKQLRTSFVPAPDWARKALDDITGRGVDPDSTTLPEALGDALRRLQGTTIPAEAWGTHAVDDHLAVGFAVVDPAQNRRVVKRGKDLRALRDELAPTVTQRLTKAASSTARRGATDWQFGTIRDLIAVGARGVGYPGLVDEGSSVALLVHDSAAARDRARPPGLRRLVLLNTPDPTKWVVSHLSATDKLSLGHSPYTTVRALLADARLKAVGDLVAARTDGSDITTAERFTALCDAVRQDNPERMLAVVRTVADILRRVQDLRIRLEGVADADLRADMSEQVDNLVFGGFVAATPEPHFSDLPRYLHGIDVRIIGLANNPSRDFQASEAVWAVEDAYAELCAAMPAGALPPDVDAIGWMIEELRISAYAQALGTRVPVSRKRVMNAIADARARHR